MVSLRKKMNYLPKVIVVSVGELGFEPDHLTYPILFLKELDRAGAHL